MKSYENFESILLKNFSIESVDDWAYWEFSSVFSIFLDLRSFESIFMNKKFYKFEK